MLSKNNVFDNEGKLLSSNNEIWTKLSRDLGGNIAPKSLYISLLQDRHGWRTKLMKLFGVNSTEIGNITTNTINYSDSPSSSCSLGSKEIFKLEIPYDTYRKIRPEIKMYKNNNRYRNYSVLKSHSWSDVINDELLKIHKLPCNFIYKRVKVHTDLSRSKHYIDFEGQCKDKNCEAHLTGWSDTKPNEGESLFIYILTRNTKGLEHQHTTKRPLKGLKRKIIGSELDKNLASNWRKENVQDMKFGSYSPPNLYSLNTLRKLKQETRDKKLGITIKCPIQSLSEFKHCSRYAKYIHSIGYDPFFVHYWTCHQIVIYKDLCKNYCKLSIDATGSLIKKQKRTSLNILSSNIFLYEGVATSSFGHIAVTQMISEKHDTLCILNWLMQWMRHVSSPPNEVVCDYSRALLSAITRAFCGTSIQLYVNNCFQIIQNSHTNIPVTFVRLDVAHMIKIFSRIKCLIGIKNKQLKEFYVRGLRLLMYSDNLINFETRLQALLTIMLCETDGWIDNDATPSEKSREFILNLIKDHSDSYIDVDQYNDDHINDNYSEGEENIEELLISNYLNNIKLKSENDDNIKGNRISAYYLPELVNDVIRLCKHFPLWTNIMCSVFRTPYKVSSSAAIENDFKQLKTQILKYETKPMKADKFVITHLKSIESNAKLFKSTELRNSVPCIENEDKLKYANIDSDSDEKNDILKNKKVEDKINTPKFNIQEFEECSPSKMIESYSMPQSPKIAYASKSVHTPESIADSIHLNFLSESSDYERNSQVSTDSMNYQENWKGKNEDFIKEKKVRSTKYMDDAPDIDRILNTHKLRSNLNIWLKNGNSTTPLKIGKKRYVFKNILLL